MVSALSRFAAIIPVVLVVRCGKRKYRTKHLFVNWFGYKVRGAYITRGSVNARLPGTQFEMNSMSENISLFPASELGDGEIRQVEIDGRAPVAIYNLNGEFFATDDTCTHGEASLAEGDIDGDSIVCPFHLGAFDIRTGEVTVPPCITPLRTYPVIRQGDALYLAISDE